MIRCYNKTTITNCDAIRKQFMALMNRFDCVFFSNSLFAYKLSFWRWDVFTAPEYHLKTHRWLKIIVPKKRVFVLFGKRNLINSTNFTRKCEFSNVKSLRLQIEVNMKWQARAEDFVGNNKADPTNNWIITYDILHSLYFYVMNFMIARSQISYLHRLDNFFRLLLFKAASLWFFYHFVWRKNAKKSWNDSISFRFDTHCDCLQLIDINSFIE